MINVMRVKVTAPRTLIAKVPWSVATITALKMAACGIQRTTAVNEHAILTIPAKRVGVTVIMTQIGRIQAGKSVAMTGAWIKPTFPVMFSSITQRHTFCRLIIVVTVGATKLITPVARVRWVA